MRPVCFHSGRRWCGSGLWLPHLEAERVEAAVCLAANRAVGLNLHGVQQVLLAEVGRPAHAKLRLLDAAGPKVVELETRRESGMSSRLLFYEWLPSERGNNRVTTTEG